MDAVSYTDPEVAWIGVTEKEAKSEGIKCGKSMFPWAASGRSLSLGRDEGITKVLFDESTDRIIGCGIVGPNAGDLIAEAALLLCTNPIETIVIRPDFGRLSAAASGERFDAEAPTR